MSEDPPSEPGPGDFEDDAGPFEYGCPDCGTSLRRYVGRCPKCGRDLFDAYSGVYRPRRTTAARIAAVAVLAVFVSALVVALIYSIRELVAGRP